MNPGDWIEEHPSLWVWAMCHNAPRFGTYWEFTNKLLEMWAGPRKHGIAHNSNQQDDEKLPNATEKSKKLALVLMQAPALPSPN
jgi:hypothetical protein